MTTSAVSTAVIIRAFAISRARRRRMPRISGSPSLSLASRRTASLDILSWPWALRRWTTKSIRATMPRKITIVRPMSPTALRAAAMVTGTSAPPRRSRPGACWPRTSQPIARRRNSFAVARTSRMNACLSTIRLTPAIGLSLAGRNASDPIDRTKPPATRYATTPAVVSSNDSGRMSSTSLPNPSPVRFMSWASETRPSPISIRATRSCAARTLAIAGSIAGRAMTATPSVTPMASSWLRPTPSPLLRAS